MNSSTSSRASSDLNELLKKENLHVEDENENEVCWDESNKDHPRNWGFWSKFYTAVVISWLELFMTGISSSGVRNPVKPLYAFIAPDICYSDCSSNFGLYRIWNQ